MLISKGILTQNEVGVLLGNALPRLSQFGITPDTSSARETITGLAAMYAKSNR